MKRLFSSVALVAVFHLAQSIALANEPHCSITQWSHVNCPDPQPNEVVIYGDGNASGLCMTISSTFPDYYVAPAAQQPGHITNLGPYGFHDCISSVKVGRNARLVAFKDAPFNAGSTGGHPLHNLGWNAATYEWHGGAFENTVNDDFSSLIVEQIGDSIPNHYVGSTPTEDDLAFWHQEPQGLCHSRTHWFVTQEIDIGNTPTSPNFTCVQSGRYSGRIWRVPRDADLSSPAPPPGSTHIDLQDLPSHSSVMSGYRHVGDPDCATVAGKDYVFVPVQGCGDAGQPVPLPYILVLDGNLNYVASWTIPPGTLADVADLASCFGATTYENAMGSGHGMGSWVAVRPNHLDVEVWTSGDICGGFGMHVFRGFISQRGVAPMVALHGPTIQDMLGLPEYFGATQGGVFSPSGNTLYLTTGDTNHVGGVRVIDPDSGNELTQTGNAYGPFNFQHDLTSWGIPTGQEPEGLDFLDTGCPGTAVNNTGAANTQSQLHVVMNHNGLTDNGGAVSAGDQVEVKHYAFSSSDVSMCDRPSNDMANAPSTFSGAGARWEDILWHNGLNGGSEIWYMQGLDRVDWADFDDTLRIADSTGWKPVGLGDFNQDGFTDILWHRGFDGAASIWYMRGNVKLGDSSSPLPMIPDDSGWYVVGVRDFNIDGHPDILWHNGNTGQMQVWYMTGADGSVVWYPKEFAPDFDNITDASGWRVAGLGDFDLDGHVDVLWHNEVTGDLGTWLLGGTDGITFRGSSIVAPGIQIPSNWGWSIVRVSDFDLDGWPDILWHHTGGETQVWYMKGVYWYQSVDLDRSLWVPDATGWRIVRR